MILKFNNGRGALCCENCNVIIMQDISKIEWNIFTALSESNFPWYCSMCAPDKQMLQIEVFNTKAKQFIKPTTKYPRILDWN